MKGLIAHLTLVALASLTLVACAAPAPVPTAVPPTKAPAAAPTTAPAAAPTKAPAAAPTAAPAAAPTKAPAATSLGKITIVQPGELIIYGGANVARAANLYKEEGLEVETVNVDAGTKVVAALLGGNAHFTIGGLADGLNAINAGQPWVSLGAVINENAYSIVMRTDVAQRLGVTYQSPTDTKIKALKGLKIGISGAGSFTDMHIRYILKGGGLDPDKDVELTALGGNGLIPALAAKQIDAYTWLSPAADQSITKGEGIWLMQGTMGDYKELSPFPLTVIASKRDYVEKNPAVAQAVMRAIIRGFKMVKEQPDKASQLTKALYPNVDATVWASAWKSNSPAFRDPTITQKDFDTTVKFLKAGGQNIPSTVTFEKAYIGTYLEQAKKDLGFK